MPSVPSYFCKTRSFSPLLDQTYACETDFCDWTYFYLTRLQKAGEIQFTGLTRRRDEPIQSGGKYNAFK